LEKISSGKMENSTQFTQKSLKEIQQILKQNFNLTIKEKINFNSGWENTNLKLICENGSIVVLRISGFSEKKPFEALEFEARVLDFLNQNSLPVPKIIPTLKNEKIFKIGEKNASLFKYFEGYHVPFDKFTIETTTLIAEFFGSFHKASTKFPLDDGKFKREIKSDLTSKKIEKLKNNMDLLPKNEIIDDLKLRILSIYNNEKFFTSEFRENFDEFKNQFPQGVLHADLHEENFLFTDDEKSLSISCALDWDDCSTGPLIFDLGYTMMNWCLRKSDNDYILDLKAVKIFLDCYQEKREAKLNFNEIQWIKQFCVFSVIPLCIFHTLPENLYRLEESLETLTKVLCSCEFIINGELDDFLKLEFKQ
jgi:Ser/Thr protein kinase RdoA (MazF antagonist)